MNTFGERAKMTFVPPDEDLDAIKRFVASAQSAMQGKLLFVSATSGSGKSTFVHSLEVFLADKVASVVRLPAPYELPVEGIAAYLSKIPLSTKFTVVNFDGREAPYFNEPEYQTFLGALNGILRARKDILVVWPVTDREFANKLVQLMEKVGGRSAFGVSPILELNGIKKARFPLVLEKILQVANWRLEDAAISNTEVDELAATSDRIGVFLDKLQSLITQRFDIGEIGIDFPTLVAVITTSEPKIRETVRSLRRADSYYIEASRLLMYTKKSNVAEWWGNRATSLRSALPHVIALFNAQLVSMSPSAVVHSVLQSKVPDLEKLVTGVRADRGNARRVMESSELFKYLNGQGIDNREYGSSVRDETFSSYDKIQQESEVRHKAINKAILDLATATGVSLSSLEYEKNLVPGLQSDAAYKDNSGNTVAIEFHHKAATEATNNKIAIYILEKLKEYAINFGLAER
jgi:hypothetical protein